jgi:hypothetical protein
MSYTSGSHTVFHHRYHIVWITKYRYKVLEGALRAIWMSCLLPFRSLANWRAPANLRCNLRRGVDRVETGRLRQKTFVDAAVQRGHAT